MSDSAEPEHPPLPDSEGGSPDGGIPEEPEGSPLLSAEEAEDGSRTPMADLPALDFWEALYSRRSIRRFRPDPVPRELVDQVMHAGIWAPSSCNYQMWDLVAVDDPEVNGRLAALSTQMANAPVNVVISYGRDFSEENFANIQSASALIQNMSLAAQVLGLGTFWITQMGDPLEVARIVGLPIDRRVVAVLAIGYPKAMPKKGPKRRPLSQVSHYNHYAGRPIPSAVDPEAWEPDLLATYQRARVLNGLRHNKPRTWEVRAIETALDSLIDSGQERVTDGAAPLRWLDVLPCTGIVTERLWRKRPGFTFDVVERSREVAGFVANRVKPAGGTFGWPDTGPGLPAPPEGSYDVVSCIFRIEGLRRADRARLLEDVVRWVKPGGQVLLGFVSSRSFHDSTERMRARRGGPGGVEYVLSPDPNVGPFQALAPGEVEALCRDAGLSIRSKLGLQSVPQTDEIEFRARNFSGRARGLARGAGKMLGLLEGLPGSRSRYGRFQFLLLSRS